MVWKGFLGYTPKYDRESACYMKKINIERLIRGGGGGGCKGESANVWFLYTFFLKASLRDISKKNDFLFFYWQKFSSLGPQN